MTKHCRYRRLDPIDSIHSLDRSIPPGNLVDRRRSTPPGGHDRLNRIVYQPEDRVLWEKGAGPKLAVDWLVGELEDKLGCGHIEGVDDIDK